MSVEQLENPGSGDPESLEARIEKLEQSRTAYFNCVAKYAKLPLKKRHAQLAEAAGLLFKSFQEVTMAVCELERSDQERRNIVVTLLEEDEKIRIELLNKLTNSSAFILPPPAIFDFLRRGMVPEQLEDDVDDIGFDFNIWAGEVLEDYSESLQYDTIEFINSASPQKAKAIEIGRIVGKQAAGVVKTAGAVALGVYINKRLEKHK